MKLYAIILSGLFLVSCRKEPQLTYASALHFAADSRDVGSEVVVAVVGTTNGPFHYGGSSALSKGQPGAFGYKSKDGTYVNWTRPTNETAALNCYTYLDENEHAMLVVKKGKSE